MDTRGEIMDCHALPCKARNDRKRGFFKQDSRACCGALCDSKNLWVGVTLAVMTARKFLETRECLPKTESTKGVEK